MSYQVPPIHYGTSNIPSTDHRPAKVPTSLPPGPPGLPAKPPVTVAPVDYNHQQHNYTSKIAHRRVLSYNRPYSTPISTSLSTYGPNTTSSTSFSTIPISSLGAGLPVPIPALEDSLDAFQTVISTLANLCYQGRNIAAATDYKACPAQERDTEKKVMKEMMESELEQYTAWKAGGTLNLPPMNWDTDRVPPPTGETSNSAKSLKIAKKRAEALNRIYKVDRADAGHAVYWAQKNPNALPLVKAVARIVGAEVAATGGNENLDAEEWSELQTLGKVISVGSQYMQKQVKNSPSRKFINGNLQVLIARRQQLQTKVAGTTNQMKRKAEPESLINQVPKKSR